MTNSQDYKSKISDSQTDSLMDLLIAQCSDLEGLLSLARREAVAANDQDFGELYTVFGERAKLGDRLETYHRQVAELRNKLGQGAGSYVELSTRTVKLVVEIQALDLQTASLLKATKTRTGEEIARLDDGQRNSGAYLNGGRANGLKWDQLL